MSGPTRRTLPLKRTYDEITTDDSSDDDSSDDDSSSNELSPSVFSDEGERVLMEERVKYSVYMRKLVEERLKIHKLEARLDEMDQAYNELNTEFSNYVDSVHHRCIMLLAAIIVVIVTLPFVMCM